MRCRWAKRWCLTLLRQAKAGGEPKIMENNLEGKRRGLRRQGKKSFFFWRNPAKQHVMVTVYIWCFTVFSKWMSSSHCLQNTNQPHFPMKMNFNKRMTQLHLNNRPLQCKQLQLQSLQLNKHKSLLELMYRSPTLCRCSSLGNSHSFQPKQISHREIAVTFITKPNAVAPPTPFVPTFLSVTHTSWQWTMPHTQTWDLYEKQCVKSHKRECTSAAEESSWKQTPLSPFDSPPDSH